MQKTIEGADFSGQSIKGTQLGDHIECVTFRNCSLEDTLWYKVSLKNVIFEQCSMHGAKFRRCEGKRVLFKHCDMKKARLFETDLRHSTFETSDLADVMMYDLYCENVKFLNTDLQSAKIMSCQMTSCFAKRNTSFCNMEIRNTQWTESSFKNCHFDHTLYHGNAWYGCTFMQCGGAFSAYSSDFLQASVRHCNWDNVVLGNVLIKDSTLHKTSLNGIQVESSHLKSSTLDSIVCGLKKNKQGAVTRPSWEKVRFENCSCEHCEMTENIMDHLCFKDCSMPGTNFHFTSMNDVLFENCDVSHSKMLTADMENTSFVDCVTVGVNADIMIGKHEPCKIF